MSFPPQGRSATPTAPPPPTTILDHLKRLLDWKAAVFAFIGFGVLIAQIRYSVVTKSEFDAARKEDAAERTKLGVEAQKIKEDAIAQRVDLQWIGAQVAEIARVTGARVVPRPDPAP